MIRFVLCIIIILLLGLFSIIDAIFSLFIQDAKRLRIHNFKIVSVVMSIVLKVSGVKVNVHGIKNYQMVDNEKAIFVISNHRGYFDILSGYVVLNRDCSIIAKSELKNIPIVGYWMNKIECLFLDRKNLRSGASMVIDAIKLLRTGKSVWVFPEGTRNKNIDPSQLLEFKSGTFKIPEKADCYILPMAILNSDQVFEKQLPKIKAATIHIEFGKAYKISELDDKLRDNIAEYNMKLMSKLLIDLKSKVRE